MIRRLLAVQGPLQYITGHIAFTWKQVSGQPSEDTLLLYDFLSATEVEEQIARTVSSLASTSQWKRIVHVQGQQMDELMRRRYSRSIDGLRQLVGEYAFDEIYLARDHVGNGSALLLNAYPHARKYSYGDSFGLVGQQEGMKRLEEPKSLRAFLRSLARRLLLGCPSPIAFDEAVLSLPIDMSGSLLKTLPLAIPSRDHVLSDLSSIYASVPELDRYCDELLALAPDHGSHLYLLSNLAGSGLTTAGYEVDLYIDIIREYSRPGDTVFIKPHPRSSFEFLDLIRHQLTPAYRVVMIDNDRFVRLPIELWMGLLRQCRLVAMFSTSSINLKYLYGKDVVMPLDEARIVRYVNDSAKAYVRSSYRMMNEAMFNLDSWDGRSPLWSRP